MDFILKKPIISEKSIQQAKKGFYTFMVEQNARKPEITKVVEEKFGVKVVAIKTASFKKQEKMQRSRRGYFSVPGFKKAFVQLKKGEKIDLFETETGTEEGNKEEKIKEKKSLLRGTKVKIEKEVKNKKKTKESKA